MSGLIDMDVDTKTKGGVKKAGDETLAALIDKHGPLGDTETVRSSSTRGTAAVAS